MGGIKYIHPYDIPKIFILRLFPKLKLTIKFRNGISVPLNIRDFRSTVGIIDTGHPLIGYEEDYFIFDFYGFRLYVPRSKLRWMPGVLDKSSPLWNMESVEGKIVLDIGGFIGESALYFISKGAKKVIISEPVPENVDIIKNNIQRNSIQNVEILDYGVGDEDGFITVNYDEFGADFGRTDGTKSVNIKVRHINEFLKLSPDLVKFNCEGCERFILNADRDLILNIPEWYIQTHTFELQNQIKSLMLSLGFKMQKEYRHNTKTPIYTYHFIRP